MGVGDWIVLVLCGWLLLSFILGPFLGALLRGARRARTPRPMTAPTLSERDLSLIAAAVHRTRPEWPEPVLLIYLRERFAHGAYPFASVLVAAVFYAVDRSHHDLTSLHLRGRHWLYAAEAAHPHAPGGTQREEP